MEKVYFQGQFFLKIAPTPVTEEYVEKYRDISFLESVKAYSFNFWASDWSAVDELHQLIIHDNKMFLKRRNSIGNYDNVFEITKEELDEEYVDFMQALKQGEYIGKYGKRTKPVRSTGDTSYMNDLEKTLVLYQLINHMIIYDKKIQDFNSDKVPIKILDARYMNNWTFTEEQDTLYDDPRKLYKDLYIESLKENQKEKEKNK